MRVKSFVSQYNITLKNSKENLKNKLLTKEKKRNNRNLILRTFGERL
jgi:flagellar capping protein FliD